MIKKVVLRNNCFDNISELFFGLLGIDEENDPFLEEYRLDENLISLVEEYPHFGLRIELVEVPENQTIRVVCDWDAYEDCYVETITFIPLISRSFLDKNNTQKILEYLCSLGIQFEVTE